MHCPLCMDKEQSIANTRARERMTMAELLQSYVWDSDNRREQNCQADSATQPQLDWGGHEQQYGDLHLGASLNWQQVQIPHKWWSAIRLKKTKQVAVMLFEACSEAALEIHEQELTSLEPKKCKRRHKVNNGSSRVKMHDALGPGITWGARP